MEAIEPLNSVGCIDLTRSNITTFPMFVQLRTVAHITLMLEKRAFVLFHNSPIVAREFLRPAFKPPSAYLQIIHRSIDHPIKMCQKHRITHIFDFQILSESKIQ